jgi:hypothetical protein
MMVAISIALSACAKQGPTVEPWQIFAAQHEAREAEGLRQWKEGEAERQQRAVEQYVQAARMQAEREVGAANAPGAKAAAVAWARCVGTASERLSRAPEPANVILLAAFHSCAAEELATFQRWEVAGGPTLAREFTSQTRN